MTAGCTRRNREIGRIAASSVTTMLPAKTKGRTLKRGVIGSMKVNPANPGRDTDTQKKSDHRTGRAQGCGFRGEKSVQQAVGHTQRLHDGKVAAAIKTHPRWFYADRPYADTNRPGLHPWPAQELHRLSWRSP